MGRSGRRVIAVLALTGLGLTLTACGGGDDDDTPAAAATDNTGNNNDTADNNDTGGDNAGTIKVDSLKDIPDKCIDIFGDYLKQIEPLVKDIDWKNADMSTLEGLGSQVDAIGSSMDAEMKDSECDKYDLEGEANMDEIIDIAKDKAPGTVAYLQFIKSFMDAAGDVTIPDNVTIPDVTIPDVTIPDVTGSAADVPQDCDGAIAWMKDLMDQHDSIGDLTVSDMSAVGAATTVITSKCSISQMNDFYNDPAVSKWMSGT